MRLAISLKFLIPAIASLILPAQAAIINSADFNVPPYSLGSVHGQNPTEAGSIGAWVEELGRSDFQVMPGGLSVEANGSVGRVVGGTGHLKESGFGSFQLSRPYGGFTGTETELWYRAVLKPQSQRHFTHFGDLGLFSEVGCGLFLQASTMCKLPKLNVPNLVILRHTIDRSTGAVDEVKGWVNPSSYANMIAGTNYDLYTTYNVIEGSASPYRFYLNWENSGLAGDSLAISTSLSDLVQPAPGPLPLLGVGAGFAMSRRLRRRIKP